MMIQNMRNDSPLKIDALDQTNTKFIYGNGSVNKLQYLGQYHDSTGQLSILENLPSCKS